MIKEFHEKNLLDLEVTFINRLRMQAHYLEVISHFLNTRLYDSHYIKYDLSIPLKKAY